MINFEKYRKDICQYMTISIMVHKDDPKQLVHFCRASRCASCLFEPENYKIRYGRAKKGCHQNRLDWIYREVETCKTE